MSLSAIFGVIAYLAMGVAHHAEALAEKYGEPYGTLILTLSAVLVEVLMIGIMMSHSDNPFLARDTIVSAIILDINGLLGLAAIIGGLKHGEQNFNFDSTNSYIGMLIVAIMLAMILPLFVTINPYFMIILFVLMYIVFTRVQIKNHSYFFKYNYKKDRNSTPEEMEGNVVDSSINGKYHATVLILSILSIGFLSELMSVFMGKGLVDSGLPIVIGALMVAIISASPELITAIKSASEDRMQTVVNIAFGASLATILLTVPAMMILSMVMGMDIDFALTQVQMILLGATILVSIVHFYDGQSNILEGYIHLLIFIIFIYLMFTGQM